MIHIIFLSLTLIFYITILIKKLRFYLRLKIQVFKNKTLKFEGRRLRSCFPAYFDLLDVSVIIRSQRIGYPTNNKQFTLYWHLFPGECVFCSDCFLTMPVQNAIVPYWF